MGSGPVYSHAVVGLGAVGSAAAWQLAKRGAKVLGIDARRPPHTHGSSHGDSRITRKAIGEGDAYVPLAMRSYEIWREAEALTGESLLTVTGGLWISSAARQAETHVAHFFDNTVAAARRFGIAHEILEADAIRRRFPQFAVASNERAYFEPDAGYLRPEACVRANLRLAESCGAALRYDEPVRSVAQERGLVRIATDRGEYRAERAIVAVGAEVAGFVPPALASRFAVTRQVQYWFDVAAPPASHQAPAFPVFIWELQHRRNVIYGFPMIDGPAGGLKVATETYGGDPPDAGEMHRGLVAPTLPGVSARCLKSVPCLYTSTPDFQFAVGPHPAMDRVTVASACSGHGFKHSAAVGEALALGRGLEAFPLGPP